MLSLKAKKVIYWVATGLVLFLLLVAASTYHVIHDQQAQVFSALGYPTYLVYPLAWLKIITIIVIISHRFNDLRDMVYAAYFINMAMALVGHLVYGDFFLHALVGLIAIPVSYLLGNQVRGRPQRNFFGKWTN